MKIERRMIASVRDQSNVEQDLIEVFRLGPEVAWALDRKTAELYVRSHEDEELHVLDETADLLVLEDGTIRRIAVGSPLDYEAEKLKARTALLARLSPEERALLEKP